MKSILLIVLLTKISFASCIYTSLKDIYKNDKLEKNINYKITGDKDCINIDKKISEVFIRNGRNINLTTISNINKNVVLNFNDTIYIEYTNSKLVSKNKNSIKIKKNNRIIKIKINGEIL
jgi:hypothetical protein